MLNQTVCVQAPVSLQADSTVTESLAPSERSASPGRGATPPPPAAAAAPAAAEPSGTFLAVAAHLGRLSVYVASRVADDFWPPQEAAAALAGQPSGASPLLGAAPSVPREDFFLGGGDGERPLISIVAEGGLLRYTQVLPHCSFASPACSLASLLDL